MVVRVDAEQIDPMRDCSSEVSVQEVECPESDEEKCGSFEKFVDGDQHEAWGMLVRLSGRDHGSGSDCITREKLDGMRMSKDGEPG
jgi:hypothetical protein